MARAYSAQPNPPVGRGKSWAEIGEENRAKKKASLKPGTAPPVGQWTIPGSRIVCPICEDVIQARTIGLAWGLAKDHVCAL